MARFDRRGLLPNLATGALVLALLTLCLTSSASARKSKSRQSKFKCDLDECQLSPAHFALYSNLKNALESKFDINGKDLVPLLRSIEVLRTRFGSESNKTRVIWDLLNNKTLETALEVLKSDDGRRLIDTYRQSINGRRQNLACSKYRIDEIERATANLESNSNLAAVFSKIHKNFVKKSAKKCLKNSCSSIDNSMSRLDYVLGKRPSSRSRHHEASALVAEDPLDNNTLNRAHELEHREFEEQETELCKFFKKTNETDCQISGSEMSEIKLVSERESVNDTDNRKNYIDNYIKAYETNHPSSEKLSVGDHMLLQCSTLRAILDLNLVGLKWYQRHNLIEDQKMSVRTFWCPGLSYWLQVDRLCDELAEALATRFPSNATDTFAYQVPNSTN